MSDREPVALDPSGPAGHLPIVRTMGRKVLYSGFRLLSLITLPQSSCSLVTKAANWSG